MTRKLLLYSVPVLFFLGSCDQSITSDSNNHQLKGKIITFNKISMAEADTSEIPQKARKYYRTDAEILSVLYMNKRDSLQVRLPKNLIDVIYNGLLQIYNSDLKAAHKATKRYSIHTARGGISHSLLVTFDSTETWVKAWENGKRFTGNKNIDKLLKKYDLSLVKFYPWHFAYGAMLRSAQPLNQFALARKFKSLKSILGAEPNGYFYIDLPSNIKIKIKQDYVNYIFIRGTIKCPSDCADDPETWSFNVFSNGRVKFVGSPKVTHLF
jgi:hypothetical protein